MIVTFYSYKGGVGRSMALVNVAEILADVGYDIILCDFDLEAPGLERYVTDDLDVMQGLRASRGVVDLLEEYRQTLAGSGPVQPEKGEPTSVPEGFRDINGLLVRRPSSCAMPISSPNTGRLGRIRFLSAGRRDGKWSSQYNEQVQQFDWSDFYRRWAGAAYVDFFREDLAEGQTIVLVDSRTGVTEHAGICTHHLADLVVLLCAPNDINIEGTKWMARTIAAADLDALRGGRPLWVMPVASRVETASEAEQLAAFREQFEREFAALVPAAVGNAQEYIQKTEIPYIPYFAFTEKVVARQNVLLHRELYGAYEALAQAVVKVGLDAGMLTMPRRQDWLGPLETRIKLVNPPPMTAPSWFQDREVEIALTGDFLRDDSLRLLTVVGRGGVGKTAMVCRLLKALETGRLPGDGGELPVYAIVYMSQVGGHTVSFPNLFADLTRVLPDAEAQQLQQLYRDPQQTPGQLMLALLEAFPDGRTIVLLDSFETVIDPATLTVSDAELGAALGELLTAPEHGVKVIATTRLVPRELLLRQPGRSKRLDLDEGLPAAEAIQVLRAMDGDGSLGLRDAAPELLAAACERTRGVPRALEALAAILAVDRDVSLPDLLTTAQNVLPDKIVEVLVGEAFERLDPLGQQVMQALAIYGTPVPSVAIDYLLQPIQPAIDSAQVLSRLVNIHFARRDAGRYYLHQVDRDYALSHIPPGQPSDQDHGPAPFTRYGLQARAADYFEQTRTPRDSWRNLDDLAAQLAEFELRCANAGYDAAAEVLSDIDFDYLQKWGHYRLAAGMHERLNGRLTDLHWQMVNAGNLGSIYYTLGQTEKAIEQYQQALAIAPETGDRRSEGVWLSGLGDIYLVLGQTGRALELYQQALAIARETGNRDSEGTQLGSLGYSYATLGQTGRALELYQQALAIARETGNRDSEGTWLGSLGEGYATLGQTEKAIDYYQQALAIARETGNRNSEGTWLGSLGEGYATLGQIQTAIEHYQQALAIARETGNRDSEGTWLGNLGEGYAALGQTETAIDYYQQALAIARETGNRNSEGTWLGSLGEGYATLGQTEKAIEHYQQAAEIGSDTGDAQVQAEAHLGLAQIHLYRQEWPEARKAAETARLWDYPGLLPQVLNALGAAHLREDDQVKADDAFSASLSAADNLLASTHSMIHVLYAKGIASAGQAVIGKPDGAQVARRAFDLALAIAQAPGLRARTLRQLDVLAGADASGILADLRPVLADNA